MKRIYIKPYTVEVSFNTKNSVSQYPYGGVNPGVVFNGDFGEAGVFAASGGSSDSQASSGTIDTGSIW